MLTKRDYVAIARAIAGTRHPDPDGTAKMIAERLADYFASDNPRFDRARFLQACDAQENQ